MRIVAAALLIIPALAQARTPRKPAEPAPTLSYVLPEGEGRTDDDVAFTEYQPGERVCRRSDGEPLLVKAAAGRVRRDGLVNRLYAVEHADGVSEEVFGGELTPICLRADFDGDGKDEPITVGFDADGQIVVRIGASSVAFRAAGEGFLSRKGGNAEARLVEGRTAGLPLLLVASRPEACGDFSETYVSGVDGHARVALALVGVADPPAFSTPSVAFDPKRKSAVVTQTELDEDGKRAVRRVRTRFQLKAGVFVEMK